MYINSVHFFSKTLGGGGGENNPVRSSISDQCYFYAKYNQINASTRACFIFNFSWSKITHSKSVARSVAIIDIFVINSGTFLKLNRSK